MIGWLWPACVPTFEASGGLVAGPRTLAVSIHPPEAAPGERVTFSAWYADGAGEIADPPLSWAFCTAPLPLAELGPVASACLDPDAAELVPFGDGPSAEALVPADACSRFGPNPLAAPGEAPGRPPDPDPTGGYYQPALAFGPGEVTLAPVRIRCGLPGVAQETAAAWNLGYHSNAAPMVLALDAPAAVAPGERATLTVRWAQCPETPICGDGLCTLGEDRATCVDDCEAPIGCSGAEGYLYYDGAALVERRESMSASWFIGDGLLAAPRGGRDGDDPRAELENTWTAPTATGEVWLGVAVRDDRGGVGFRSVRVPVR